MKKKGILKSIFTFPLLGIVFAFGLSSCNDNDDTAPVQEATTIVDVASASNDFSTLVAAVDAAGLVETLSSPGPFTVFAPTNDAFARFLQDNNLEANDLLQSPELGDVLTYHVLAASVPSSSVTPGRVNTVSGVPFFVSQAPNGNLWINGNAQIIQTDVTASNGIIHVLDYVITPPTQSIAEIAIAATESATPQFTQLVAALVRADLAGAVSGGFDDDLTVFAPTDAAFEALYDALGVNGIDDIPLETLTNVLLYHVVPARAFSQDLRNGAELPTLLEGANLTVNLGSLQINESNLVESLLNIHATNGVIHVIDRVLLPE
ncbi:fasciclin domain-containing protein [Cecembia calidifontis]|uniref:Putative surface protein with fasciclin (FAS1) repeats n=1 Tax=Cecembia calidifontis TaxID=1187080 RepID=A0A4Q7P6T3_9BACT|nr:fasciclin domain-containing protein [Cecembia calidifontis]RZS95190.1 putative surface protein with fasciclin (FAS1) repeats [Cecembia calidifontis]